MRSLAEWIYVVQMDFQMTMLTFRPGGARTYVVGSGVEVVQAGGGGGGSDADAAALIAAMSPAPDGTRQMLINDTIVALKAAGIWDELDELWLTAAHAEQAGLLGWKRYKDLTAVNAPTFRKLRRFKPSQ